MKSKKYRIIKTKVFDNRDDISYHAEIWRWYWPFWTRITALYDSKNTVKCLISDHRNKVHYVEKNI